MRCELELILALYKKHMFTIGHLYSKNDIYQLLHVSRAMQKGAWDTGYRKYEGAVYVFCNIGVAGRTGHDYNNHWDGKNLVWYAKTNTHVSQPLINEILNNVWPVHIFTREENKSPFTYQGQGKIESYEKTTPVKITWSLQ